MNKEHNTRILTPENRSLADGEGLPYQGHRKRGV